MNCSWLEFYCHHPASAELREDFVAFEACAGLKRHFFASAVQLTTTDNDEGAVSAIRLTKRKRWPSAVTS